jgi:sporulation protein YqfC
MKILNLNVAIPTPRGPLAEVAGLPIVTLNGRSEAVIENHRGVSEYETTAITVRGGKYDIRVTGENLTINAMNSEKLTILGAIDAVTF